MMQLSDNVIPLGVCFFFSPCSVALESLFFPLCRGEDRKTHFGHALRIILWMAVKIELGDFGTETLLVGVGDDPNWVKICKFQKIEYVMVGERDGGERRDETRL